MQSGGALDTQHLIARLRAARATVQAREALHQPFFRAPGRIFEVDGEAIQVFEYADRAAAEADAVLVSPDGRTVGTSKPLWAGTPRFYRKDRLLILYLGEDARTLALLASALGPPFAGG